ncbi:MAG: CHAT domain-containing protein [Chitinophagales bacterium]|nr:CHAT domain-containing protein [Chitinophagales bacterium]
MNKQEELLQQAHQNVAQAEQWQQEGRYTDSIALLAASAPIFEAAEDWNSYVNCLNKWSEGLCRLSQSTTSLAIADQALLIYQEKMLQNALLLSTIYLNQSACFRLDSQLPTALNLAQKALALRTKHLDSDSILLANAAAHIALIHNQLGQYAAALQHFNYAEAILLQHNSLGAKTALAINYTNKSLVYCNILDTKNAIQCANRSTEIIEQTGCAQYVLYANYLQIGHVYMQLEKFSTAQQYYQTAFDKALVHHDKHHHYCLDIAINMAAACFRLGDVAAASPYIDIIKSSDKPLYHFFYLFQLASYYLETLQYELAITYFDESLATATSYFGSSHFYYLACLHNLGNAYVGLKKHDSAIHYLQLAIEKAKNVWDGDNTNVATYWHSLGVCYMDKEDYERSFVCLTKAIAIHKKHTGGSFVAASADVDLGTYYYKIGRFPQALKTLTIAYKCLFSRSQKADKFDLNNCLSLKTAALAIEELAKVYAAMAVQKKANNRHFLIEASITNYLLFDAIIDKMRDSYSEEKSKLYLAATSHKVYEKAIETVFMQLQLLTNNNTANHFSMPPSPPEHLQHAFYFSEKSKAMVLLQQRRSIEARMAAVLLPSDLRQKEEQLHEQLHLLKHQLQQEELKPPKNRNAAQITEWQGQHAACLRGLTDLQAHLRSNHYHYWYFRYNLSVATLADLQSALHKDTALISYFVGENSIYYFVVTKTSVHVDSLPKPADLSGLVKQYMDNLAESYTASLRHYIRSARACYQTVVEPVLACIKSRRGLKRLVIIPDGALYGMSFGALLTKDTQSSSAHQLPYLERRYQIDYHYSATLWLDSLRSQSSNKPTLQDFIGYAPVYLDKDNTPPLDSQRSVRYGDNHYASLPYSQIEVEACSHAFEVRNKRHSVYLHEKATLNNFKQTASNANYLLIAGHTTEDDLDNAEKIGIVLSPESKNDTEASLLTLADIYTLPLSSRLVVLSCCNTGVGSTLSGEGAMAINRGFLYAGVRGVVYTLFRVRDIASSELSPQLFEHFLKMSENDAAKALHLAKLDLIGRNSQPLAWAGFAFMGH